jgi:RNA polymerase sigma factor (sigma-70 family)
MPGSGENLLARFRSGEREAIMTVSRLARRVVGHRGYYIPREERDDLVQEVVVHVYRAVVAPDFRPTRAFEAFVRSVAQRRCVDWARHHRPVHPVNGDTPASGPDPEQEAISAEMLSRAREALSSLGFSCLRLIRLRVKEGLSYREIAERLDRTELGVRVQMYKCLKRAKTMLERSDSRERTGGED